MKSKNGKKRVLVKLQKNKKFDVFDELLKIVIVRGLIAIGILLVFSLFLAAGFSIVITIVVFLASLLLSISQKAWKRFFVLCLAVGIFILLFLVPFHQTKTMYAAEINIKSEYLEKNNRMFILNSRTDFYSSYEEAKEEVEQDYPYIPLEAFDLKQITKRQDFTHPIVYFQLPKNPNNNEEGYLVN